MTATVLNGTHAGEQFASEQFAGRARAMAAEAARPLVVRGLNVAYARKPVLWQIDYAAPTEGLIAIVGPNGAGKSTFIKACLGLVPALSGEVSVFGGPVRSRRRMIGYVPQRSSVDWDFPVTALDVVLMGRYGAIGSFRPITLPPREAAMAFLDTVGLADFAGRQVVPLYRCHHQPGFPVRLLPQEAGYLLYTRKTSA